VCVCVYVCKERNWVYMKPRSIFVDFEVRETERERNRGREGERERETVCVFCVCVWCVCVCVGDNVYVYNSAIGLILNPVLFWLISRCV